jgi:hypothetical protein
MGNQVEIPLKTCYKLDEEFLRGDAYNAACLILISARSGTFDFNKERQIDLRNQ